MGKHLDGSDYDIGGEFPTELRYDLASGNWVVVAAGRSKRPETFKTESKKRSDSDNCPFCNEEAYEHFIEATTDGETTKKGILPEDWSVAVIPNKFPAFFPGKELKEKIKGGLYKRMNAIGYHEVIITEDHQRALGEMSFKEARDLFLTYRNRYRDLKDKEHVNYISIFHNHGSEAGASIAHPHSQLATTPLIDVDLKSALKISYEYRKEEDSCLHCDMQRWEKEEGERIVYENEEFLVLCPFASKVAFQLVVTPKKHLSNFEEINEDLLDSLTDAFLRAMNMLNKGLGDPPYNFYLQTAPCDGKDYDHYHWHWTILPRTAVFAGFEFGARMEISTIKPETAAQHLKSL